ncbi:TIGR02594 family protein [Roseisalinus antarcticus]|uniref:Uncharacterized protein n=1 Tax=Roseisalinus antarcticus TaxID=254357 RepID=A0A1Y5TZ31_9RHOB|nr:TIGR02594 family protein [Roseisalinus antarcticus]SLN74596.1 hypothetical protein ROA7023_03820 [Roseisalinus antarcticus]
MRKTYHLARAEIGTVEWAEGSNPTVDRYFDDVGFPTMRDDTAWCAAFVGAMLHRSGLPHTRKLTARSYLDWGKPVDLNDAEAGDVVIFWRGSPESWTGHVAFFVRREGARIIVVGGNQRDQVSETGYPEAQLLGVRRMTLTSKTQSTTLRAAAGAAVAGAGGVAAAVGQLDPAAQSILIGASCLVGLGLLWIVRERLQKWAEGDR